MGKDLDRIKGSSVGRTRDFWSGGSTSPPGGGCLLVGWVGVSIM